MVSFSALVVCTLSRWLKDSWENNCTLIKPEQPKPGFKCLVGNLHKHVYNILLYVTCTYIKFTALRANYSNLFVYYFHSYFNEISSINETIKLFTDLFRNFYVASCGQMRKLNCVKSGAAKSKPL